MKSSESFKVQESVIKGALENAGVQGRRLEDAMAAVRNALAHSCFESAQRGECGVKYLGDMNDNCQLSRDLDGRLCEISQLNTCSKKRMSELVERLQEGNYEKPDEFTSLFAELTGLLSFEIHDLIYSCGHGISFLISKNEVGSFRLLCERRDTVNELYEFVQKYIETGELSWIEGRTLDLLAQKFGIKPEEFGALEEEWEEIRGRVWGVSVNK